MESILVNPDGIDASMLLAKDIANNNITPSTKTYFWLLSQFIISADALIAVPFSVLTRTVLKNLAFEGIPKTST